MNPTTKTIKSYLKLFKHQDVAEYTQTVLFYIASCTDIVTEEKYIHFISKPETLDDVRSPYSPQSPLYGLQISWQGSLQCCES